MPSEIFKLKLYLQSAKCQKLYVWANKKTVSVSLMAKTSRCPALWIGKGNGRDKLPHSRDKRK